MATQYDVSQYDDPGSQFDNNLGGTLPVFVYPNGETPMFRIGLSERTVGEATGAPEGYTVYNMQTGNLFEVSGGVWAAVIGAIDPLTLQLWRLS